MTDTDDRPDFDFENEVARQAKRFHEAGNLSGRLIPQDRFVQLATELAAKERSILWPAIAELRKAEHLAGDVPTTSTPLPRERFELTSRKSRRIWFLISLAGVAMTVAGLVFLGGAARIVVAVLGAVPILAIAVLTSYNVLTRGRLDAKRAEAAEEEGRRAAIRNRAAGARSRLFRALEDAAFQPAERALVPPEWGDPGSEIVRFADGPALSSKSSDEQYVATAAHAQVSLALTRSGGSTIGLSGPRGAGKTELAHQICRSRGGDQISVWMWAPVAYEPRVFLLGLLRRLCDELAPPSASVSGADDWRRLRFRRRNLTIASFLLSAVLMVMGLGLIYGSRTGFDLRASKSVQGMLLVVAGTVAGPLSLWAVRFSVAGRYRLVADVASRGSEEALRLRRRIDFTEKTGSAVEIGASISVVTAGGKTSSENTETPLTDLDLVDGIRTLVGAIDEQELRVVIAIDEVDKIHEPDQAAKFLNELKVLFPIKGCSFLISISDQAWARFAQRGLPFRDAFDSSFDEVVRVEPFSYLEAREMLIARDAAVTSAQALVVFALSGGLPREMLRTARALSRSAARSDEGDLNSALEILVSDEIRDIARSLAVLRVHGGDPKTVDETPSGIDPERMTNLYVARDLVREYVAWIASNPDAVRARPRWTEAMCHTAILLTVLDAVAAGGPFTAVHRGALPPILLTDQFSRLAEARASIAVRPLDAIFTVAEVRAGLGMETFESR